MKGVLLAVFIAAIAVAAPSAAQDPREAEIVSDEDPARQRSGFSSVPIVIGDAAR
jgi:hypothetical protein